MESNGREEVFRKKAKLFDIGIKGLERDGWTISKIPGSGKSSHRKIAKNGEEFVVVIKTTQEAWPSFQRTDTSWNTLPDVDKVVVVSVQKKGSNLVKVHLIDGKDLLQRLDQAYEAQIAAGYRYKAGSPFWISLYKSPTDYPNNVLYVGGGVGSAYPPIHTDSLSGGKPGADTTESPEEMTAGSEKGITIPEAKRLLSISLGVDPSNIKILVEA